ncbi:hypothetical protein [Mycolicibacterium vulneris]|uniref:hypothetical protein n=1 Tax=Mycolicibacterium vulneris TaxID=547163 RepID=UPI001FE29548|nr:hypothetical protein [Mycolicibacterium vulneris]
MHHGPTNPWSKSNSPSPRENQGDSGQPAWRFMRYIRPPDERTKLEPIYPLRPATRTIRLGIDVETVPEPPDGLLTGFLKREELIEVHLMVPKEQGAPAIWTDAIPNAVIREIGFTSIGEVGRWLDTAHFFVHTTVNENERSRSTADFFPMYQQLDEQAAPNGLPSLTLDERHRAAAYAAAGKAVGLDAIVTNMPTAGRSDVSDNDLVVSVTPDEVVPLVGHYLRITSNPVVTIERGPLMGGGAWETTESAGTVVNLYDWGTVSGLPYFDAASSFAAAAQAGPDAAEAFKSIRIRLSRAAKALDHLLAALSNPVDGKRVEDVTEAAAEAFDRELLYLSAVFDIFGRTYQAMINPALDQKKARGSLDSRAFVENEVATQYDPSLLIDVTRLRVYAWLCKQLRNHIHDGILAVDAHPGRSYGSSKNVALNLGRIPELAPGADNDMSQAHYDALGVWHTEPMSFFEGQSMVADLATTGFTLMRSGLEYVEAFTKLIIRNKPQRMLDAEGAAAGEGSTLGGEPAENSFPSRFLGCVQAQPGEIEPPPPHRAVFYSAMFGWHPKA